MFMVMEQEGRMIGLHAFIMVLFIIASVCAEEQFRIVGTVTSCFHLPVADARITVQQRRLHTVTDRDGQFFITDEDIVENWNTPAADAPDNVSIAHTNDRLIVRNSTDSQIDMKFYTLRGEKLYQVKFKKNSEWCGKAPVHASVCAVAIETGSGMIQYRLLNVPDVGSFHLNGISNAHPSRYSTASLHNNDNTEIVDTLVVSHDSYDDYTYPITGLRDSVAIQLGTPRLHTSGLQLFCDDTIAGCGLDCDTFFYSISASDQETSVVRTCGASTDTAWLELRKGVTYQAKVDLFCPGSSDIMRTIHSSLERGYDSVQVFNTGFGAACDSLQMLYPNGGEHFVVGDTVEIQWCYPDRWPHNQVKLQYYRKAGRERVRWLSATGAIPHPQDSFLWIVEESDVDDSCLILLSEYSDIEDDYADSVFMVTMENE